MLHSRNLLRLAQLRVLFIAAELAAIVLVRFALDLPVPALLMLGIVGVHAIFNAWTWHRAGRAKLVPDIEISIHLVIDTLILALLLGLSGGGTNPFIMLLLMPIAITAAVLPSRHVWSLFLLAVAAYTLLLFVYRPLPETGLQLSGEHGVLLAVQGAGMHVVGMWLAFLLTGLLIAMFATRLSQELRERDRALAESRERQIREDAVFSLASMAANTAHELSTPLASIAVLASELEQRCAVDESTHEDFRLLKQQLNVCKRFLGRLREVADGFGESEETLSLEAFSRRAVHHFSAMRKGVSVGLVVKQEKELVNFGEGVLHVLVTLLNNAADASPADVSMLARREPNYVVFRVLDRGSGFSNDKAGGLGVGLILASAMLDRVNGALAFTDREGGGTVAEIVIPLAKGRA